MDLFLLKRTKLARIFSVSKLSGSCRAVLVKPSRLSLLASALFCLTNSSLLFKVKKGKNKNETSPTIELFHRDLQRHVSAISAALNRKSLFSLIQIGGNREKKMGAATAVGAVTQNQKMLVLHRMRNADESI